MLRLSDRITVAFGAGMGIQLSPEEVELMVQLYVGYKEKKLAMYMAALRALFKD